jgi:hypothetical protein
MLKANALGSRRINFLILTADFFQFFQMKENIPIETPIAAIEYSPNATGTILQKIELDGLGPVIINENGTISRITNWGILTEQEKATTRRVIAKRNLKRMDALKALETKCN